MKWFSKKCYVIPDGITSIGNRAFESCHSLTKIEIPHGVTSIGDDAFWYCENLTIYGYPGTAAETYAKENDIPFVDISTATPTNAKVLVNGKEISFTAYNIGGNNYFKLRDIGKVFDFGIGWDNATKTITIDTSIGYTE